MSQNYYIEVGYRKLQILFLIICFSVCSILHAGQSNIGSIITNGQKTIPMGWYVGGSRDNFMQMEPLDEYRYHGADFIMHYYPFQTEWQAEVPAYLDAALARNARILVDVHSTYIPVSDQVNIVKDHPAVYGYYLDEEVIGRGLEPEWLLERRNTIESIDNNPNRLIFMNEPSDIWSNPDYLPLADVVIVNGYNLSEYQNLKSAVAGAEKSGKYLMWIPRAYTQPEHQNPETRVLPTADEFKYMMFAPLSAGVDGLILFLFDCMELYNDSSLNQNRPEYRKQVIYPLMDIINFIRPILLKDDMDATSTKADNDVTWICGGDSEEAVLIAVNNNRYMSKPSVDFHINDLDPTVRVARVIGEDRVILLDENRIFSDSFDPLGVHVYHLSGKTETVQVKASQMTNLRSFDNYAFQDYENLRVGHISSAQGQMYSAVLKFDLSAFQNLSAVEDGTIKFYAKLDEGNTSDTYIMTELNKNFEPYPSKGLYLNEGLNFYKRNSSGDLWTTNPDISEGYNAGGVWDTTFGQIGVFDVSESGSYELITVDVDREVIQRWLSGENYGLVISGTLEGNINNKVIHIAGPTNISYASAELEFEAKVKICGGYYHPAIEGDINKDCTVNMQDFVLMSKNWLNCTAPGCN